MVISLWDIAEPGPLVLSRSIRVSIDVCIEIITLRATSRRDDTESSRRGHREDLNLVKDASNALEIIKENTAITRSAEILGKSMETNRKNMEIMKKIMESLWENVTASFFDSG